MAQTNKVAKGTVAPRFQANVYHGTAVITATKMKEMKLKGGKIIMETLKARILLNF
jgi:molybdopterin-binding protein